jgi:hypothetical protein
MDANTDTLSHIFKRNWRVICYYLILLLILVSWTNTSLVSPPMILRAVYTFAFFLPLVKYSWMMPFVVTTFWSIRLLSVAPFGYLPTEPYLYLIGIVGVLLSQTLLYKNNRQNWLSRFELFLVIYIFTIDIIYGEIFSKYLQTILIGILLYNQIKSKDALHLLAISFIIISFVESMYFFAFREDFATNYIGSASGLERSTWIDPNYFGIILGMGIVISLAYLLNFFKIKTNFLNKVFFITTIIISFIVVVLQASRGAILDIGVSCILLMLFSKIKLIYKIIILTLIIAFVLYLFNNNYFELLMMRIEADDGTGSGRLDIWNSRLRTFSNQDPLQILFGMGQKQGLTLGTYNYVGSHNEFISTLVIYGIVGLIILIGLLLYPIINANQEHKSLVSILIIYLVISFMTLEPLTLAGYISINMLLMLTLLFKKQLI